MTATIHPFPRLKGDYEPSQTSCSYLSRRLQQGPLQCHLDGEVLRKTRHLVVDCWALKAESASIKRRYEARQRKIEDLMRRYDVERA